MNSLKAFVGLVGLVGNTLCLLCFSLKKNKSNFHYLMLATAVFDILYIFSASTLFSVPHIIPRFQHFQILESIITLFWVKDFFKGMNILEGVQD